MLIETSTLLLSIFLMLCGLGFVIYSVIYIRQATVEQRIEEFVLNPLLQERQNNRQLESQIIRGAIFERTITPIFQAFGRVLGRFSPASEIQKTEKLLAVAGNPYNLRAATFFGIRVIFLALGGLLTIGILFRGLNSFFSIIQVLAIILGFYFLPVVWLNNAANQRRESVRRELPDALDMLSVLASVGFNFNQSISRVSEQWDTHLGTEFGRVISEMEIGITRQESLLNMSQRLDVSELSSFVAVMVQSEKLGTSISEVLHTQADQIRVLRQYRAKEAAQRLPARMMIPLALLILPALLYVVLVPLFLDFSGFLP
jgi:tight adherence protein C